MRVNCSLPLQRFHDMLKLWIQNINVLVCNKSMHKPTTSRRSSLWDKLSRRDCFSGANLSNVLLWGRDNIQENCLRANKWGWKYLCRDTLCNVSIHLYFTQIFLGACVCITCSFHLYIFLSNILSVKINSKFYLEQIVQSFN